MRNFAQPFQRFINDAVRGFDLVAAPMDDFLVFSSSSEQHMQHPQLFQRQQDYGLVVSAKKCLFKLSKLEFLGYHISSKGIRPLEQKIKATADFTKPATIRQLRRFFGLVNFHLQFIARGADIIQLWWICCTAEPSRSQHRSGKPQQIGLLPPSSRHQQML